MAMLAKCFFCRKEFVVPSADDYESLENLEKLEIFDEYKKESHIFTLYGSYSCRKCYNEKIIPIMLNGDWIV